MITSELTFEQAKQIINSISGTSLESELQQQASNIKIIFDMMFKQLEAAICECDDKNLPLLQGGDVRRLMGVGINIPYYMICEQYENIDDFAAAFVVICSNYFNLNPCDYLPVNDVVESVARLIQHKNSFTKLIVASNTIIHKLTQMSDVLDVADMGISRQFISTMLDENIDYLS